MKVTKPISELTEKEWDYQLFNPKVGLASSCGWRLVYHTFRSRGSQPGFPDRVLVRDRIVYAELKREKEKPTDRQRAWLDGLSRAGGEVYLWRPSDLAEIGEILARRWNFFGFPDAGWPYDWPSLTNFGESEPWTPDSLWIPGYGRAGDVEREGIQDKLISEEKAKR